MVPTTVTSASSLVIVPVPVAFTIPVAFWGLVRLTAKVSSGSPSKSPIIGTLIVRVVESGVKVTVPVLAV